MKKPKWVIQKERSERARAAETIWLFGLHAVRDALLNPSREKLRLIVTKNAADKLADAIATAEIEPEFSDPRKFLAPLDPQSVHQGAAIEVKPLGWGSLDDLLWPPEASDCVILLDRVSDPHNVGAILRSSEVFGAKAVIAPSRQSAPETGALAKTASGALERKPYIQVQNLARTMEHLRKIGFVLVGLDGEADQDLADLVTETAGPIAFVLGAEGPGLRQKTKETCDHLVRINSHGEFGSLNVSNAAAVSLFAWTNAHRSDG